MSCGECKDFKEVSFDKLIRQEKHLLREAHKVLDNSYCPDSKFQVAAGVLTSDGRIFVGVNVENAAYGEGICAEKSALVYANAKGAGNDCVTIAIVTRWADGSPTTETASSCGGCIQVIGEFADRSGVEDDFRIILATTKFRKVEVGMLRHLASRRFSRKDLAKVPA